MRPCTCQHRRDRIISHDFCKPFVKRFCIYNRCEIHCKLENCRQRKLHIAIEKRKRKDQKSERHAKKNKQEHAGNKKKAVEGEVNTKKNKLENDDEQCNGCIK